MMLSYAAWQREFGGDPRVLGKTLRLNGEPWQVVGVLPRGFVGPMGDADLWLPLDLGPTLRDPIRARAGTGSASSAAWRRAPPSRARSASSPPSAADLAREHPDSDAGLASTAVSLRDAMVGDTRTPLLVLMASAGARAPDHLREPGRRAALAHPLAPQGVRRARGARRRARPARPPAAHREHAARRSPAARPGSLLADRSGSPCSASSPCRRCPPTPTLSLDRGAVLVTVLLALGTGIAFGVAPGALRRPRRSAGHAPRGARGASESRRTRRLRGALVAGQIALCVSLLAGGGAARPQPVGDGHRAARLRPGRRAHRAPSSSPDAQVRRRKRRARFYEQLEERLRALPGVTAVATRERAPDADDEQQRARHRGRHLAGGRRAAVHHLRRPCRTTTSARWAFRCCSGRASGPRTRPDAPPAIVISEAMARRYWPKRRTRSARASGIGPNLDGAVVTR